MSFSSLLGLQGLTELQVFKSEENYVQHVPILKGVSSKPCVLYKNNNDNSNFICTHLVAYTALHGSKW